MGVGDNEAGKLRFYNNPEHELLGRVIIGLILILVSLIPLGFVANLIKERGYLYNSVAERMTEEWSGPQKISGPILSIPYEYTDYVDERVENKVTGEVRHERRPVKRINRLAILPETLDIKTGLETQELTRGIYRVPIYSSESRISGTFRWPDLGGLNHMPERFIWDKAILTFLIGDANGIQSGTALRWNNSPAELLSGNGLDGVKNSMGGVHARPFVDETFRQNAVPFELVLNLRGSRSFSFAANGKDSTVALNADWAEPSFNGKLLPDSREIGDESFSAKWNLTHLSRSYEQVHEMPVSGELEFLSQLYNFSFGADLFRSVDLYVLLNRTIKYGIMFVSLTFFSIFILEFASGVRMHWIQHLIIGAALSMFYLCVLAFSEHIPFGRAYAIGVALISLITGCYAWASLGKWFYGLAIGGVMLALYTVLYSLLQMEDYALLIGTLLLLVFLVIGMIFTRNMGQRKRAEKEVSPL